MSLIINGQEVDEALLDQEFASIKSYYESLGNVSCCERDEEFRGYARDNVIARVLLTQEAERRIAEPTAERVDHEMERLAHEHGGEAQLCVAMGITPDQMPLLRGHVAQSLRVETLLSGEVGAPPAPDEATLRAFYREHTEAYLTRERVRAMHILKNPRRTEDRAAAYEELRRARRRALAGEDFAALAREFSDKVKEQADAIAAGTVDGADAVDPIDLGFIQRGELVEEFEMVAFSMSVGEVSPVFASPFGFHLVKVTEREEAKPRPFEEVREKVEADHFSTWRDEQVRQYVQRLRAGAAIED